MLSKFTIIKDKHYLFEIITHEYGGHATSSSIYDQTVHSFSVISNRTGRILYQGQYSEGGSGGSYTNVGASWFSDRHILELWLTGSHKTVGDFSYIQRLVKDQYKLSDSTIEFARALDLYRRNVQRADDWQTKMKNATKDPDYITPETLKENGVTVLENRCAEN